jgi:hypothetical protein
VSASDGENELSQEGFARWLQRQIANRTPAAAVRFGDAEAKLLALEKGDERSVRDVIGKLEQESGASLLPEDALELKRLVELAFEQADVLGIGFSERFLAEHKRWMEWLASRHLEQQRAGRKPVRLAHCLFSHQVVDSLPEMLAGRLVSVISCRDLKPVLEGKWGTGDVAPYQVPSQYIRRYVDGAYEEAMHSVPIWPDAHERICSELAVRERGEVFLVGAGVFGKDLCIRVRDQGGIAVDMGSALDGVVGKMTRGVPRRILDLHATGMPTAEIASHLERLYGFCPQQDAISRNVTRAANKEMEAWRERPPARSYAIIHFDSFPARIDDGESARRPVCHVAVGTAIDGGCHALGIWWTQREGIEPWPKALEDLRRRGVASPAAIHVDNPRRPLYEALAKLFPAAEVRAAGASEVHVEIRKAVERHGPFISEEAATRLVYLALIRAMAKLRRPSLANRRARRAMG